MHPVDILWRRCDTEGHEACRLERCAEGWRLQGMAAYLEDGRITCVHYTVNHDASWIASSARVVGWCGPRPLDIRISRTADGQWSVDDRPSADLAGALDIDLGFSPATNTSAIRRLELKTGESKQIVAAWLDTTDWTMKPLEQEYMFISEGECEYRSIQSGYRARLSLTPVGLVERYPGLWHACASLS